MSTQAVYLRGDGLPAREHDCNRWQRSQHRRSLDCWRPAAQNIPLRNSRSLGRQPEFRSSRAALGAPAADSGPTITKDVIYITLDIGCRNVPRAWMSTALPALCTGKPITAGVVVF